MSDSITTYRLAWVLGARLVGRSLVTLGVLVAIATVVGPALGAGWRLAGAVGLPGLVLVGGWAWYLGRRAWALRLTAEGYVVRMLRGVGVSAAPWSRVREVVAASPGGTRCLVIHLVDGSMTRLPTAAVAADADALARDVRRRLRDAHTPASSDPEQ